jgi:hypothetical protein
MTAGDSHAAQQVLDQDAGADYLARSAELRRSLVCDEAGNGPIRGQRSRMRDKSTTAGMVPKPQSNQEVQLFPNVNATSRWGTVQNVVAVNVPKAAEQVNSASAHRAVLMAGSWTNP